MSTPSCAAKHPQKNAAPTQNEKRPQAVRLSRILNGPRYRHASWRPEVTVQRYEQLLRHQQEVSALVDEEVRVNPLGARRRVRSIAPQRAAQGHTMRLAGAFIYSPCRKDQDNTKTAPHAMLALGQKTADQQPKNEPPQIGRFWVPRVQCLC